MITDNLKKLNIELPNAPDPVGAYVAYKIINNLLYISGQLPIESDGKMLFSKIEGDENTIMGLPVKQIKDYLKSYEVDKI